MAEGVWVIASNIYVEQGLIILTANHWSQEVVGVRDESDLL